MPTSDCYNKISEKIASMKRDFPYLRNKSDDFAFSALCVRANYFKNPSLEFSDDRIKSIVVDGQFDGGVDAMLLDPNTEENNLVLVQSKFYQQITFDDVRDAIQKLILFYKDMDRGDYQNVNSDVQRKFLSLNAEVGEESKICFVFYTSAPKNKIQGKRIEKLLAEHFSDTSRFEISLFFGDDIIEEIKEMESRRPTVESGKIVIDMPNNALIYGDNAAIVNASAFSIKDLYAQWNTNLLSRNLRYYIKKKDIDQSINDTIKNEPDQFWFRNNGITIVCSEFSIDGRVVTLKNFSIVNGGQTTTLIHRSSDITKEKDLYLPCKIIQTIGDTDDEKSTFILEIAKATNSQKPIKQIDLKSNAPEQIRFCNAMREAGVFYQTKRGENIPRDYREEYKNTDLAQVGKLALAAVFQLPATSRNKPSSLYQERFYNIVFDKNQNQMAGLIKELLYLDYYFRKTFIFEYDKKHSNDPISPIAFAHNARTICIAFVALSARYKLGNFDNDKLRIFFEHSTGSRAYDDYLYDLFSDIGEQTSWLPKTLFNDKDNYDKAAYKLFEAIIISGFRYYLVVHHSDSTLNETNFLKQDQNYYAIVEGDWSELSEKIDQIYGEISNLI
jgi:hypothetical protein